MPKDLWCVLIQKLHPDSVVPTRGTAGSAGFDFSAYLPKGPVTIGGGGHRVIPTGIAVAIIDPNWEMQVRSRSGLGGKEGVIVRQGVATFDSDYRGEVLVCMWNTNSGDRVIHHGQRFCQGVFSPVWIGEPQICETLPASPRGQNGWGSTGR